MLNREERHRMRNDTFVQDLFSGQAIIIIYNLYIIILLY